MIFIDNCYMEEKGMNLKGFIYLIKEIDAIFFILLIVNNMNGYILNCICFG